MLTSTPFGTPMDVFNWLSRFINLESGQTHRSFRLDRMKILADMAGNPEKCAPSLHVAGSKGKGSVTGMIAAILDASGMKISCYASPHVSDFRERLLLGRKYFDDEIYVQAGNELRKLAENLSSSSKSRLFNDGFEGGEEPTFFELITLWFFLCTRLSHCSAMAVETGMGGRLDATNILDPLVSVITLIELEHTEYLGNTIAEIAAEKAGIIKDNRPLVLAEQSPEALKVFMEHAEKHKSRFIYFPDYAEISDVGFSREGTSFTLTIKKSISPESGTDPETFSDLFIPIPGTIQPKNAALAILALKTAFPQINENDLRKGLAGFTLPARFERISDNPEIIVDGAHTKNSVEICLKTFIDLYGRGGILIFGCAAGKDVNSMAELCAEHFSGIIITRPGTFKKSSPELIYAAFNQAASKFNNKPDILFIPDTKEAINMSIDLAHERRLPVLGTGSFYLAGEIRKQVKYLPD